MQGNGPFLVLKRIESNIKGCFPTEAMSAILGCLHDLESAPEELMRRFMQIVMDRISKFTGDELKQQSTDALDRIVSYLQFLSMRNPAYEDQKVAVYTFWLDLALKYMHSSSLPLRLHGWELVPSLIHTAIAARSPPLAYEVVGAGCPLVNGIYEYANSEGQDGSPQYILRRGHGGNSGGPRLTLFQCKMRTGSKWWFISEPDRDSPGTDKDVDYYQHKSEDKQGHGIPPESNWSTAAPRNSPLHGLDPPPTLKKVGLVVGKGKEEDTLEHHLVRWTQRNRVVEEVFGGSIHREVVSRSVSLLRFLCETNVGGGGGGLTKGHIDLIWNACVGKAEAELQQEIYAMLSTIVTCAPEPLIVYLIHKLGQAAQGTGLNEAVALVQVLASKDAISSLTSLNTRGAMLDLLWSLLQLPAVARSKSSPTLEEAFAPLLRSGQDCTTYLSQFMSECLQHLHVNSCIRTGLLTEAEEAAVLRALQLVQFLLDSTPSELLVKVVEDLSSEPAPMGSMSGDVPPPLPKLLLAELRAFKQRFPHRVGVHIRQDAALPRLTSDLQQRLALLRFVHCVSPEVSLSATQLQELWNVLSSPPERELFIAFLHSGARFGEAGASFYSAFSSHTLLFVFADLICQVSDWGPLRQLGYKSFNAILQSVVSDNRPEAQPARQLGLDTLWSITLSVKDPSVATCASDDLLQVYSHVFKRSGEAFVDTVFQKLDAALGKMAGGDMEKCEVEQALVVQVTRLLGLLQGAIGRGAARASSPPHCYRGEGVRRTVTVCARRLGGANQSASSSNSGRGGTAHRLDPFLLSVHPLETIGRIKARIADRCKHANGVVKLVPNPLEGVSKYSAAPDDATVLSVGIGDGEELQVLLLPPNMQPAVSQNLKENDAWSAPLPDHIGEVVAANERYFDTLFGLLTYLRRAREDGTAHDVWGLLMVLPTEQALLRRIAEAGCGVAAFESWCSLLGYDNWFKTVYSLQVVDMLLCPAQVLNAQDWTTCTAQFRDGFMRGGGFDAVLNAFMMSPPNGDSAITLGHAVSLRILRLCLFEAHPAEGMVSIVSEGRLDLKALLVKLLQVSGGAQGKWSLVGSQVKGGEIIPLHDIISNALTAVGSIIRHDPSTAQVLVSADGSRNWLVSILLSNPSGDIRSKMGELVTSTSLLGRQALYWLSDELHRLGIGNTQCSEYFLAMEKLVGEGEERSTPEAGSGGMLALASALNSRLLVLPQQYEQERDREHASIVVSVHQRQSVAGHGRDSVLCGCLSLLRRVLESATVGRPAFASTDLGRRIIPFLFSKFLFPMSAAKGGGSRPVCTQPLSRRLAFQVLSVAARANVASARLLLEQVERLVCKALPSLHTRWGLECTYDSKRENTRFVGLRNQGCTCYMNSLLQQLFMAPAVRRAICGASSMRKLPSEPEQWVGLKLALSWEGGTEREALVVGYDKTSGMHRIQYAEKEDAMLLLREGRPGKETGIFSLRADQGKDKDPDGQREAERSRQLLEQVQRTFIYLRDSEKRYFDPRSLVEACRCLNLQYSVYQQNDASEFCTKLLDRLDAALKGQGEAEKELARCFGGRLVHQKIPRGCEHRTVRKEPFINLELIIRGKESIQDSLASLTEGELMEGDNRVECEDCGEKKDCIRRTCLGSLPNILILHLKRFDLDYNTFETVKLNNRCAFPLTLDVKPYTSEGIEEREAMAAAVDKADGELTLEQLQTLQKRGKRGQDEEDYLYELKGILVHAGVAQGGHYYSFIREKGAGTDPAKDLWLRFDDEDVTPFNPADIEVQCFGGTAVVTQTYQGVPSSVEQDRVANALLLFYDKVRPTQTVDSPASEADTKEEDCAEPMAAPLSVGEPRVGSGADPFEEEVWQSNLQFILHSYVFDAEFHAFLRGFVTSVLPVPFAVPLQSCSLQVSAVLPEPPNAKHLAMDLSPPEVTDRSNLRLDVIRMALSALLDIILHSRERFQVKAWLALLCSALEQEPSACEWLLKQLLCANGPGWLRQFALECPDVQARGCACRLFAHGIALRAKDSAEVNELIKPPSDGSVRQGTYLVRPIIDKLMVLIGDIPTYWRTAEELFLLIREAASADHSVRRYMVAQNFVACLAHITMREESPLASQYPTLQARLLQSSGDFMYLLEAMAAILGVSNSTKVELLEEPSVDSMAIESAGHFTNGELTPRAREALEIIFAENSESGGMDSRMIVAYCESCGQGHNLSSFHLKNLLTKYDTLGDGRLSLQGFLRYYRDTAANNPKRVWSDLYSQGFSSDLKRLHLQPREDKMPRYGDMGAHLPTMSRTVLSRVAFYECAYDQGEQTANAILCAVAYESQESSRELIYESLAQIANPQSSWSGAANRLSDTIMQILVPLLSIEDELQTSRISATLHDTASSIFPQAREKYRLYQAQQSSYHHTMPQLKRLVETVKELRKIPAVEAFMDACKHEWDWMGQIDSVYPMPLHTQAIRHGADLMPLGGGVLLGNADSDGESGGSERHDMCNVEHAGTAAVNGKYVQKLTQSQYPSMYFGKDGSPSLHIFPAHRNGGRVWVWVISEELPG
jgi:ubiquitin C-terminal hydrolase